MLLTKIHFFYLDSHKNSFFLFRLLMFSLSYILTFFIKLKYPDFLDIKTGIFFHSLCYYFDFYLIFQFTHKFLFYLLIHPQITLN